MKNIRFNVRDNIIIKANNKTCDVWDATNGFWYSNRIFYIWSEVCDSIWKSICLPNQRQYAIPLKNQSILKSS